MKKLNFFGKRLLSVAEVRLPSVAGVLLLATMMCAPFTASAQVTIGSGDLPQATLDIVGTYPTAADKGKAFRLDDGNQAPGKVLTCQDNGIGTWTSPINVLNEIEYIEESDLFKAANGWEIIDQATQRFSKIMQYRIRVKNTVPINFNATTNAPLNNGLIATVRISPHRYIEVTGYSVFSATYKDWHQIRLSNFTLNLVRAFSGTTMPVNTEIWITGFFMVGQDNPNF